MFSSVQTIGDGYKLNTQPCAYDLLLSYVVLKLTSFPLIKINPNMSWASHTSVYNISITLIFYCGIIREQYGFVC